MDSSHDVFELMSDTAPLEVAAAKALVELIDARIEELTRLRRAVLGRSLPSGGGEAARATCEAR